MCKIATRISTPKFATMLFLTLTSCLFRGTVSLIANPTSKSSIGKVRRNHLCHFTVAGKSSKTIYNGFNNRPNHRSFFQNHILGERVRLSLSTHQNEMITGVWNSNIHRAGSRNQNRSTKKWNMNDRFYRKNRHSMAHFVTRNLSTSAKTDADREFDSQGDIDAKSNNKSQITNVSASIQMSPSGSQSTTDEIDSSSTSKSNTVTDSFVNVLSIDPEHVDIYERTDEESITEGIDEKRNHYNPFESRNFIDMFRGSANYIASHRNTLAIFHIPGDLMEENPKGFRDLMNDISLSWLLGMKIVIVAGCRYQINKRTEMNNDGRQEYMGMVVTDEESLRIVKEEAGYVRFEVERQLARALKSGSSSGNRPNNGNGNSNGNGSDGSDMPGGGNVVSGNFYSAQPFGVIDGVDYQYSGFVRRMEVNKIHQVLQNQDIVLLTSLGFSPTGEVFNVNSEYLAAYAGGELGANKIIYFLENNTALRHKIHRSAIPHLRVNDGCKLLDLNGVRIEKKGFVYMDNCPFDYGPEQLFLVKMGWGMNALRAGVKRVHLISPLNGALLQELYTRDGSGTMISGDLYDGIQVATVNDATAIYEVIAPLVEKGILVERSKAELERDIEQYHVYTRDGLLIACGQLKMFENGFAEFGCLVVNPLYRSRGRGDAMLGYLERLCVQNGATNLFVLSTQTMEWFVERGFDEVGVECLPPSRQATYNHDRRSKIYMKRVDSLRDLDASELFWDR